ncbi:U4/U6 small nuclear ribonucleoprotein Prp4 [Halotydeus destructor]|nr:U4/U6 small nuclear ribonucleoprotein Prp4 [Halotydeus destructor]
MDPEDVSYVKRQKVLHYGSLEEAEKKRLASGGLPAHIQTSTNSNQINVSKQYMNLEEKKNPLSDSRQLVLDDLERKRRARQITVTVDDNQVQAHLRHLEEPICLFGEGPADRRERLRNWLARLGEDAIRKEKGVEVEEKRKDDKTWYHEGPESLRQARFLIAEYSIPRASTRLAKARIEKSIPESTQSAIKQEIYKSLRNMEICCSQVGDNRPVTSVRFSPDTSLIATASWSGLCKLWTMPNLDHSRNLRGHNDKVCDMKFHPNSTVSNSVSELNLASSSVDGSVLLWNLVSEEPISSLTGHTDRVSHVAFHPCGRYLATCCHDKSWRLWDLETSEEILYQEGHSKAVFDIAFQCDGSLAVTGGWDAFGRVWDLRTGRCVMFMEGHLKEILAVDFSPNGYQIVTGSEDHSVKIWDMRNRKCEYTIPAHNNIVSRVMFEKTSGHYIATASYDNTVKLWACPNFTPIQTLSGHDNKVMCLDASTDSKKFLTSSYDRTFKLWTPEAL